MFGKKFKMQNSTLMENLLIQCCSTNFSHECCLLNVEVSMSVDDWVLNFPRGVLVEF